MNLQNINNTIKLMSGFRKLSVSIILLIIITQQSFGQLYIDKYGVDCFKQGSKLLEIGDYKAADSLLTISLCTYKNENVYFNRGMSRLLQFDTIGFCEDFNFAANKYFDHQAAQMFNSICCIMTDTFYYDRKFLPASKEKFRFTEEIRHLKYDTIVLGIIHDKTVNRELFNLDYGCEGNLLDIGFKTTDIVALYKQIDSIKYFLDATNRASILDEMKYLDLKKRAAISFQAQYGYLKKENNIDILAVVYELTINKEGKIENIRYEGLFPDIPFIANENLLEKEIIEIVKRYPDYKPAKFRGESVNSIIYDFIEY